MPLDFVILPDAGEVNFDDGLVDYYAETDPVAAGADQYGPDNRPLRNLAYRDRVLAGALNRLALEAPRSYMPSPQATPDSTLLVGPGHSTKSGNTGFVNVPTAISTGAFAVVAAGTERYDLVELDDSGTLSIVQGTPVAVGTGDPFTDAPTPSTDKLAIAVIKVDEDTTVVVDTTDITDVREFLNMGSGALANIPIQDSSTPEGTATTLNFGNNLNVTLVGNIATIDAVGGGSVATYKYQKIIATAGQTVFDLSYAYALGTNRLVVLRNGKKALNYAETDSDTITLDSGAESGDVFEFLYFAADFTGQGIVAYQLFTSLTVGQTVLSLGFNYTLGSHQLQVFRNGQLLTVGSDYAETSTSSLTLTEPIESGDEEIVVWSLGTDTMSMAHTMAFHDDAAEMFAPGQTYRDLVIECDSITQVVVKAGTKVLADNWLAAIAVTSDLTADITTSGANGLDTGVEAADTWYYVWLIKNPVTGTVASLLSTSATAPTLPSGYTLKRLVSVVRNNSSSNLQAFQQVGCDVDYLSTIGLQSGSLPTNWTALDLSTTVPPLSRMAKLFQYAGAPTSGLDILMRTQPGTLSGAGSGGVSRQYVDVFMDGIHYTSVNYYQPLDASQVFSVYANGQATANGVIQVQGYIINL